ncbi:hypothetical protein [Serratia entomophila]|uniref:Uncharacterized protein n=1 Tax=Serratia entomophila TaxID=42906 RepID=A0ABY5CQ92_9GAMM|nr:hypothetical protein [Serratia entomophila]UIW17739.1 hypothetical protein KHA73_20325 [Serratia entomophila]USV00298.1 hypothetical protein KFQ06_20085 [Serratia entomophila]
MNIIFRSFSTMAGIIVAASLLSGAGVAFTTFYAAPKNLSVFVITIIFVLAIVKLFDMAIKFCFPDASKKK